MEYGDDATYPIWGVGSIYFQISFGDVLELDNVYSWVKEEASLSFLNGRCIVESFFWGTKMHHQ